MAPLPLTRRKFTPEEYMLIERAAETRSEFLDGEIFDTAEASEAHIVINDNLTTSVNVQLRRTPCQGMSQNMKVPAGPGRLYAYPDYLIVCGEKRWRDPERDVLLNPLVLFEILSRSTDTYDRTTKFDLYKYIDSFKEYVLISQDQPRVEQWQRLDDGSWRQTVLVGMDAELSLQTVAVKVLLADLYDRVEIRKSTVDESRP